MPVGITVKRTSYRRQLGATKREKLEKWSDTAWSPTFSPSHTDPSYYQSTSDQVATFMKAGKTLADIRKAVYDFADGKDTGAPVPLERTITDAADISQAFRDEQERLVAKQASADEKQARLDEQKEVMSVIRQQLPETTESESKSE